jgi:tRNA (Thr-GGU) A37 N-methylase
MDEFPSMTLKSVGFVRNEIKQPAAGQNWEEIISEIVIDNSLTEALDGLEEFSHIIVLYWMHRVTEREMPLKTPNRPNRIGESTVKLLQRQGNILRVKGLDALNGTPVIDIKPYIAAPDLEVRVPSWLKNR